MVKTQRTEQEDKLWKKIKKNMKDKYKRGEINNRYSYKEFCNDFISDMDATEDKTTDECLCGHAIEYNYEYKHKKGYDTFILGSSCIITFSTENKKLNEELRTCLECKCKIKKNKSNMCTDCKEKKKNKELKEYKERFYKKEDDDTEEEDDIEDITKTEDITKIEEDKTKDYEDLQKRIKRFFSYRITCQCGKPKKEDYKTCYNCYSEKKGVIIDNTKCKCGKTKKPEYKLCYHCNLKK